VRALQFCETRNWVRKGKSTIKSNILSSNIFKWFHEVRLMTGKFRAGHLHDSKLISFSYVI
jgi:hypothetical protein